MNKRLNLLQAVLASSCLVVPHIGQGAFNVGDVNAVINDQTVATNLDGASVSALETNTITATGQINESGVAPGIAVSHKNNTIEIAATGAAFNAVDSTGVGQAAINIQAAASSLTINNNANRTITSVADGILAAANLTTINNSGTITGATNGINSTGTNLTITNNDTGTIAGTNVAVSIGANSAKISNSGIIDSTAGNSIKVLAGGTNLTIDNTSTGKIGSNLSNGESILVSGDSTTINNSGEIFIGDGAGNGNAIVADAAGINLTINNAVTGLIGSSADGGSAISVDGAAGGNGLTITNAGSDPTNLNKAGIGSTGVGSTAVNIANSKLNSFTNSGDIANLGTGFAIDLNNVTGTTFTNSGEIYNSEVGSGTVRFAGGTSITNGFVNTGDIENLAGGSAIFYAAPSKVTFFQQGGTVTGDVDLNYNGAGQVFNMSGGSIIGDVTDSSAGGSIANVSNGTITGNMLLNGGNQILNFSGGTLTGTLTANNAAPITLNLSGGTSGNVFLIGGDHIVNLSGGSVQTILGLAGINDTVNLSGGSYVAINGGAGGADVLNVLSSFSTTGLILNMNTVQVKSGVFNVNPTHTITNVDTLLQVDAGASMNVSANIAGAGTFVNNGTTTIFSGSTITVGGLITNNGTLNIEASSIGGATSPLQGGAGFTNTGNLSVNLRSSQACPSGDGLGTCGSINLTGGVTTLTGSTITAAISNPVGEIIPYGSAWDIITGTNAGVVGAAAVTTPSVLLSFAGANNGGTNSYQLTASAIPFSSLPGGSEITNGLKNALDNIIADNVFGSSMSALLGQFQNLTSAEQVEQALRTLVPNFNHSISTMSSFTMRRAFDDIGMHLEELQGITPLLEEVDSYRNDEDLDGWSYGDPLLRHKSGAWLKPYAGFADQQALETIDGYKADYTGITGGMDWRILDWVTVGVAGSFAKTDITQRGFIQTKQNIDSLQLTLYGQFDPYGPLYFNTLFGAARHKYDIDRTITVGSLVQRPQANYHGIQYAGQLEMGYAYFNGKYYVNPLAKLKYMRLVADNYTETGAPLGITVDNNDVSEFVGAIGLKLAMQNEYLEATYIPEITALISYDFIGDSQETFNNFAVGSPTFKSIGIKPDQTTYILNVGLRIHTFNNSMFKIAYEFEAKDQYKAHSAMFKWYYKWY